MSLINMKLSKDNNIFYNLENIEALVNEKVIEFEIENTKNVYNIFDEGCIFKRENDEFEFVLDTIKKEATYLLKETNTLLDIIVEKCEFEDFKDKIRLSYQLESDDCLNIIEIEKGENNNEFFE